jgi:hypothetical protein
MAKHKLVKFTDGIAKVEIIEDFTPYLHLEDKKTLFLNPNLKLVRGVPPELWTVRDGNIVPLQGRDVNERLELLKVDQYIEQKSNVATQIQEEIEKVRQLSVDLHYKQVDSLKIISEHVDINISALSDRILMTEKNIEDKLTKTKQLLNKTMMACGILAVIALYLVIKGI